jgi:hypothetical protein
VKCNDKYLCAAVDINNLRWWFNWKWRYSVPITYLASKRLCPCLKVNIKGLSIFKLSVSFIDPCSIIFGLLWPFLLRHNYIVCLIITIYVTNIYIKWSDQSFQGDVRCIYPSDLPSIIIPVISIISIWLLYKHDKIYVELLGTHHPVLHMHRNLCSSFFCLLWLREHLNVLAHL